ncbi:MAG: DNA methylase [Methanobacteriota archaeon]|nr:MAG: DNA methylase [Euryarchaeota archaeon]
MSRKTTQSLAGLTLDPQNANKGTPRGAQMVEDSLRQYGAGRSILVDRHGVVIAGNKTLSAAVALGLEDAIVVPTDGRRLVVVQRTDLDLATDAAAMELGVLDNRASEVGLSWDAPILQSLAKAGADLSVMFTADELAGLIAKHLEPQEGLTDPDATPDLRVTEIQAGDLFELGGHRLLCGSSTDAEDVQRVLAGDVPLLMVTDPPYGVDYDPTWRRGIRGSFADVKADGLVTNDDQADWTPAWELFPGDVAYVWHGAMHSGVVEASLMMAKFETRAQIVWAKQMAPITRGHYRWQHEPCWYAVRKGSTAHWIGDHSQTTVWPIRNLNTVGGKSTNPGDAVATHHGTQKPVDCVAFAIRNHSCTEIYEPFSGSGTALIAAEQLGRKCYAVELEPQYVQAAIDRWEAFTGKQAQKVGEAVR